MSHNYKHHENNKFLRSTYLIDAHTTTITLKVLFYYERQLNVYNIDKFTIIQREIIIVSSPSALMFFFYNIRRTMHTHT